MGNNRRLRYSGFSFLARVLWTVENLEGGKTSLPKIIGNMDSVNLWTQEISPHMKEWFKEKAIKYMKTTAFESEKKRHKMRQQGKGQLPNELLEKPTNFFNADVLTPTDWAFVLGIDTLYKVLMDKKKSCNTNSWVIKKTELLNTTADVTRKENIKFRIGSDSDLSSDEEEDNDSYNSQDYLL